MAAAAEPISPELALVCPELRAWALLALPEPVWATRSVSSERRPVWELPAAVVAYVAHALGPAFFALLCVVSTTMTFTLVADALRGG